MSRTQRSSMDTTGENTSLEAREATSSFNHVLDKFSAWRWTRRTKLSCQSEQTPQTSDIRRQASLLDHPVTLEELSQQASRNDVLPQTYLYLAYGSNLSAETFRGRRNVQPLSQMNVVVPAIALTFDLAGIPYTEPCFGNCRYRDAEKTSSSQSGSEDYHKDRWKKGLVGVLYEVSAQDYAHIIATEGGGAGYKDVLVDCYALSANASEEVPLIPSGLPIKAHTLFAPPSKGRPDPSYAQPSARYKKLITDGAEEHDLPHEYRDFLDGIRTYQITSTKQKLGQWIFNALWLPVIGFLFLGGGRIFLRKDGTYPKWFAEFAAAVFRVTWASYDNFFKPTFGDGERSITDGGAAGQETHHDMRDEKCPLLSKGTARDTTLASNYDAV